MHARLVALVLAASAPVPAGAPDGALAALPAIAARCTPTTVVIGGNAFESANPIADAIERAGPGSVIDLAPGEYPSFAIGMAKDAPWNARTRGGSPGAPITVRALGAVRVVPSSSGDTIAISPGTSPGHITFQGLEIVAGYRAAVMFYKTGGSFVYQGFRFVDCDIDGGFDHLTGQGRNSKWGVWAQCLSDFEFRGLSKPARVHDVKAEHAFYIQNSRGDVTIENVHGSRLGRTFVQFTARPNEGPEGIGTITVRKCVIDDPCIAAGDNYKGGSAITIAGRHRGTIVIEGNRYRAGFAPGIRKLTTPDRPYGTGALVANDGGGARNGTLILRDNDFEIAPECGDRPLVKISGCDDVRIVGANRFASTAAVALELDPPGVVANGKVLVERGTQFRGEVRIGGAIATKAQIEALASPAKASDGGARR
jgi:hypothetical protein